MSDDLSPGLSGRSLANALEGLVRSEAWRAVEHELRQKIKDAAEDALALGAAAEVRHEKAGYWNGLRDALNTPGRMLEATRREGDDG